MFFKILISLLFGFTSSYAAKLNIVEDNIEKVKGDGVIKGLLYEQIDKEHDKILKNKALLDDLEKELSEVVDRGLIEREKCIRKSISALRTINHVYNWLLDQVDSMSRDEVRKSSIDSLDRMKYLNKRFSDINYRIYTCYLNDVKISIASSNEMTKYAVDKRSAMSGRGLSVVEEFEAARSPFR